MHRHGITRLTTVVLAAATVLLTTSSPAAADDPSPLYVNNTTGSNCSDAGSGTQAQPYCTISAAVAAVLPGQTINVVGTYTEHVTIAKSGTPGHPITLQHLRPGRVPMYGADTGFTIDGQHDISIIGFNPSQLGTVCPSTGCRPVVLVSNSTRITLNNVWVGGADSSGAPSIQLAAVTDSSVVKAHVSTYANSGIDVFGSNNTIVASFVGAAGTAGITIEPGSSNNIIANNDVTSRGGGIYNTGATGTAITNNTVHRNCGTGIRVAGASVGVSVQNNVVIKDATDACDPSITDAVDIGVYDDAVNDTVVDYNTVHNGRYAYAWSTPMRLADFRAASGQAAHDIDSPDMSVNQDSANSAAPGWQSTDRSGYSREDNPNVPNTGAGPISYADRGSTEVVGAPTAQLVVAVSQDRVSITVDASGSTVWAPMTMATYTFDFGDGTIVTQSTPTAAHSYRQVGIYQVSVTVTDTNRLRGVATQQVSRVGRLALPIRVWTTHRRPTGALRPPWLTPTL